jgi:hypothetical protein
VGKRKKRSVSIPRQAVSPSRPRRFRRTPPPCLPLSPPQTSHSIPSPPPPPLQSPHRPDPRPRLPVRVHHLLIALGTTAARAGIRFPSPSLTLHCTRALAQSPASTGRGGRGLRSSVPVSKDPAPPPPVSRQISVCACACACACVLLRSGGRSGQMFPPTGYVP